MNSYPILDWSCYFKVLWFCVIQICEVFLYFLDDFTAIVRIYLDAGYIFEEGFTPVLVLFVRILECCCADLDVVVFILLFK